MNNESFNENPMESNECTSRGVCSIPPAIAALQELIRYLILKSVFYIVKLEELNLFNEQIKSQIINIIANLMYINEYNEQQMYLLSQTCYYIYENSKEKFLQTSKENDLPPTDQINYKSTKGIAGAITYGSYLLKLKNEILSPDIKNLLEILFLTYKSATHNISLLEDFKIPTGEYSSSIIKSICKLAQINSSIIKNEISNMSVLDFNLRLKIASEMFKNFGNITKTKVSFSSRKGKCILVSGNNFFDLINILTLTKDKDIDVYSHSNLLISHAFDKFKQFPNFIGHYENIKHNCVADYATFPGAVLLTKNSQNNTAYLYRGRIFSNDFVTPTGVIKLENNDYSKLIQSAQDAKGFSKGQTRESTMVGFNLKNIKSTCERLSQNIQNGIIKRIYILFDGLYTESEQNYINKFVEHIKNDEFVILYSNIKTDKDNVFCADCANSPALAAYLTDIMILKNSLSKVSTFIFPYCDISAITLALAFYEMNIKNLYISKCSARTVNPKVFKSFIKNCNISIVSDVAKDLENMQKKFRF